MECKLLGTLGGLITHTHTHTHLNDLLVLLIVSELLRGDCLLSHIKGHASNHCKFRQQPNIGTNSSTTHTRLVLRNQLV